MNPSAPHPHRRRLTRAEVRRRRRSRAIRRVAGLTVMLCVAVGGVSFLLTRHAVVPSASAASAISMPAQSIADSTVSSAENTAAPATALGLTAANALGLTADEARAMLADPLMVLVNHTSKMPDDYTFDTKECGSATAVNKTLQTVACDAFLEMQKAAAADGVTVWLPQRQVPDQPLRAEDQILPRQGLRQRHCQGKGRCRRQPSGILRAQLRPRRRPEQPGAHRSGRGLRKDRRLPLAL